MTNQEKAAGQAANLATDIAAEDADTAKAARRGRKPARQRPARAESGEALHGVTAGDVVRAGHMAVRMIQDYDAYKPTKAGGYVRISDDPYGLERGVTRQTQDIHEKAGQLGWTIAKTYPENDTSAYRKKKITLPDGTVVFRVVRPQFRQMLEDLFTGVIDGIIVYDQDRLLRQPRDLEDLIDIVEAVGRPVTGITSSINLMTSDGRAMARVMCAMALKSSEDTARRVVRAKLQDALDGFVVEVRRFGRNTDGSVIPEESEAATEAARIVLASGKWCRGTKHLEKDSGITTVQGGHWHDNTVRNMLLNPSIAGISVYRGSMRVGNVDGKMNAADPQSDAVRDAEGGYVFNGLDPVIPVEVWEALCTMARDAHEGRTPGVARAKKYLLSGLLRCGNLREDGTRCGRAMVGTRIKRPTKSNPDKVVVIYKCSGLSQGGCGKLSRSADKVDEFMEEVFFRYLSTKAPKKTVPAKPADAAALAAARARLAILEERLSDLRRRYTDADPNLTPETYYATLPDLERSTNQARETLAALKAGMPAEHSAKDIAEEWKHADTAGKRMILARYLVAIEVMPSQAKGLAPFDATAIRPQWKNATPTQQSVTLAA
ncbi:MAG TPA: recombinase family protein [Actinocrinis sp.]|nr:recombinase family protein [Actinocrinis sp.]